MYKLKEITSKDTWNNFIIESDFGFYSFLQSWQWGEFQIKSSKEVIRYGIFKTHPQPLPNKERILV
jgi:hypothetical protein